VDRLGWILGGLNGAADWGGGDANVLAPEFAAVMPPDAFTRRAGRGWRPSRPAW
jgi:hypothetical protein